ncbi:MAG TPA: TolC family protein [Spirochaetes bacterium]|nr:TolC family protein [Spirochaetota bacterium]
MKRKTVSLLTALLIVSPTAGLYAREKAAAALKPVTIELAGEPAFMVGGARFTLGDAIRLVLEKNRDTLSGAYDVAMTDSLQRKYQAKYSPYLSLEGGAGYTEYPTQMGPLVPNSDKSWDIAAAVAKMFSSGTTVSAGLKHLYNKSDLRPIVIPGMGSFNLASAEYHQPVMFVSIQQELLRNAFGYNDRRQQEILKNAAKMQREMIIYQLSGLVVGAVVEYWTVVMHSSAVENARLELQETRRVRDITAVNVRLGLSEAYELNFYNTLVAGAEAKTASSLQQYRDAVKTLLATLNLPEDTEISEKAVLSDRLPEINEESALKYAYGKRADYQGALLSLTSAKKQLEIHENDALPRVVAELNLSSLAQRVDVPPAYGDAAAAAYPSLEARVKVTYPLDDREQKTNERDARYRVEQAKIQVDKYRRLVRDDISRSIEHVGTYHLVYEKAREARLQAERYYQGLLGNLRRGRLRASIVKDGLVAMVESRQQERQALIQFNLSLLQMEVAKNGLFEKYGVVVDEYVPGNGKKP